MNKINAKMGIGPMSSETIEAVFRYSGENDKELMLIASKNQIDYEGGYVNNWTTREYIDFIEQMRNKYPKSCVKICRDHCGPGFNVRNDLEDTYETIEQDIRLGFDLIHIDFCHYGRSREEILRGSERAIKRCLELNPSLSLEIGTDDNVGYKHTLEDLAEIKKDVEFFRNFCNPEFFVVQTGSLIKEINQVGEFNSCFVKDVSDFLRSQGIKLKEHNADYLSSEELRLRRNLVDSVNIAPQLGVVQSASLLNRCLMYGIDIEPFIDEVHLAGKWKKWMQPNSPEDRMRSFLIAGHYHFSSDLYKKIVDKLGEREDIREGFISEAMEVIRHYDKG